MPRNSALNVMNWQLQILTMLPSGGAAKGITAQELKAALLRDPWTICEDGDEEGNLITKIQKTLRELAKSVPWRDHLVCQVEESTSSKMKVIRIAEDETTTKTMFWKWKETAFRVMLPPLNEHASLALLMLEKRLKNELPPATLSHLAPFFKLAKARIQMVGPGNRFTRWQKKIVNQPPTQQLSPPSWRNGDVQDAVLRALFDECQLQFSYLKRDSSQYQTYVVSPLGVVMRGPVTYLVAIKVAGFERETENAPQMFALHRMRKADALPEQRAVLGKNMTFDTFLERGGADFVIGGLADGQVIQLKAEISASVAQRLEETPLSDNQVLKDGADGTSTLTVSLPLTMQLGWWLLGFGHRVKVIAPAKLRDWIAGEHRRAADRYSS